MNRKKLAHHKLVVETALAASKAAIRAARKLSEVKGRTPTFSFRKDGTVTIYIAIEVKEETKSGKKRKA